MCGSKIKILPTPLIRFRSKVLSENGRLLVKRLLILGLPCFNIFMWNEIEERTNVTPDGYVGLLKPLFLESERFRLRRT